MPENKKTISQIEEYIACSRKGLLSDLRELVRIPSVSRAGADGLPFGAPCRDVLEKALEIARRRGIRAENHQNRYVLAELGEGEKTIGIFCHLDVVPAGGGWQYPPFEVTEKDGLLIGRGVCDNKGGAAAMLCVLSAFRELNLPLHSRLRLFLAAAAFVISSLAFFVSRSIFIRTFLSVFPSASIISENRLPGKR